jgi:large subunit ribosomal protein L28
MANECFYLGKKASMGNSVKTRGKAKYLGGVGTKKTGITRRKFKPNLQRVRAVVDGDVKRIWVSTQAIRMGLVQKPVVNKPFSLPRGNKG